MPREYKEPQTFEKGLAPHIPMADVESSQVKSIGYDATTNTLAVQFTRGTGAIYHYPGVTPEQHQAFIKADSIGTHFGKHFKSAPFKKYAGHAAH